MGIVKDTTAQHRNSVEIGKPLPPEDEVSADHKNEFRRGCAAMRFGVGLPLPSKMANQKSANKQKDKPTLATRNNSYRYKRVPKPNLWTKEARASFDIDDVQTLMGEEVKDLDKNGRKALRRRFRRWFTDPNAQVLVRYLQEKEQNQQLKKLIQQCQPPPQNHNWVFLTPKQVDSPAAEKVMEQCQPSPQNHNSVFLTPRQVESTAADDRSYLTPSEKLPSPHSSENISVDTMWRKRKRRDPDDENTRGATLLGSANGGSREDIGGSTLLESPQNTSVDGGVSIRDSTFPVGTEGEPGADGGWGEDIGGSTRLGCKAQEMGIVKDTSAQHRNNVKIGKPLPPEDEESAASALLALDVGLDVRCPICDKVFYYGGAKYDFYSAVTRQETTEIKRFIRSGRRHCQKEHPDNVLWNVTSRVVKCDFPKCFEKQVDYLVCLAIANGNKIFPLENRPHTLQDVASLLLKRLVVADRWFSWILPQRGTLRARLVTKDGMRASDKARRQILCLMELIDEYLTNGGQPKEIPLEDYHAVLNRLQLLGCEPGRHRRDLIIVHNDNKEGPENDNEDE